MMERSSGILLAISSLPGGSIGTLGRAAFAFVDFLSQSGQGWWQLLPIGPTGYGDSPYQSFSTFAGNPYYIDPELLCAEGLLSAREAALANSSEGAERFVDYGRLFETRFAMLYTACLRALEAPDAEYAAFAQENADWLEDYALFMALKRHFNMAPWTAWEREIRLREKAALENYAKLLQRDVQVFCYAQYLFFKQWRQLRAYANARGVKLMGDLPIYVALDSADVWANPEQFLLDSDGQPVEVAGVPPDYFSAFGQLWGNPLYRWDDMRDTGFSWWMRRLGMAASLYDAVRIDHFRGFSSYWAVPFGETTAIRGKWRKGPGTAFIDALKARYPDVCIVAEDLGDLSEDVHELLAYAGFPGMKVLQFAFSPDAKSEHLPHNIEKNCVCYTGTHDNDTLAGWLKAEKPEKVNFAREYLGLNEKEGEVWGLIRGGMSSAANLFIAPMQDYLELDSSCRMNVPGTAQGNWRWRLKEGECTPQLAARIRRLTQIYGRLENCSAKAV